MRMYKEADVTSPHSGLDFVPYHFEFARFYIREDTKGAHIRTHIRAHIRT